MFPSIVAALLPILNNLRPSSICPTSRSLVFLLMASQGFGVAQAQLAQLCSSQNTGSDGSSNSSIYQSIGLCQGICHGYAFGIVQAQNCWCSNIEPVDTVSSSTCDADCPGYPDNKCGNLDQGLFGYIALGPSPSSTAGSDSSSSPISSPSTTTEQDPTTPVVVSVQPSLSTVPQSTTMLTTDRSSPSTSKAGSTSTVSSSAKSTSAAIVTQSAVTSTYTVSGVVVTQTVAPTITAGANSLTLHQNQAEQKSSTSGGTIAGAVVGAILGVALIALAAFLLWRRHRKNQGTGESKLGRNASVMSKAGLLAGSGGGDLEKDSMSSPAMQQRESFQHTLDHPIPSAVYVTPPNRRRDSKPLVYDQRLNPEALMQNWEINGSRASVNTMHDQRDYSRPLKVSNPDIEDN